MVERKAPSCRHRRAMGISVVAAVVVVVVVVVETVGDASFRARCARAAFAFCVGRGAGRAMLGIV